MAISYVSIKDNGMTGIKFVGLTPHLAREDMSNRYHPMTVHNKQEIRAQNIRTLIQCGQLENIKQEMNKLNINIL